MPAGHAWLTETEFFLWTFDAPWLERRGYVEIVENELAVYQSQSFSQSAYPAPPFGSSQSFPASPSAQASLYAISPLIGYVYQATTGLNGES